MRTMGGLSAKSGRLSIKHYGERAVQEVEQLLVHLAWSFRLDPVPSVFNEQFINQVRSIDI